MTLIVGASSYIGRHLFQACDTSKVIGTYRNRPIPEGILFDATKMCLEDVLPQDIQINQAVIVYAIPEIDACKADIDLSYDVNVRSTKAIIDTLVNKGIKPIFLSSEYVFDGEKGNYTESDEADPNTVYGSQKLEIETYLADVCEDFAVLRLAKVFGTDPDDGTILAGWWKQICAGEEIQCAYDQVFSPVHVSDVVAASLAVKKLNLSGIFHLAGPESFSRLSMCNTFLESLHSEARVVSCSLKDLEFLDYRPMDLSMRPQKILDATRLAFRTVRSCCDEFAGKVNL